ncbi:hypothetical protein F5Y10DRAFT_272267 [Nemania abortiva]|nr:hypothetical protein F5Y10DRAFT_272267 [Nemania abortiva]
MSRNVNMGEEHTPSKSLDNAGLLIYRDDANGNPELLLRYWPGERSQGYSIPNRVPYLGETALETAIRVGQESLETQIPPELLDYQQSVVINNAGESARIRVFIMGATREIEETTAYPNFNGWNRTRGIAGTFKDTLKTRNCAESPEIRDSGLFEKSNY